MTERLGASEWNARYLANDTGWDKGTCAPPIARMLREGLIPPGARVAVVGAGRGHEACEAASLGFEVTAVDFAPQAIEAMTDMQRSRGLKFEVLQADVFELGTLRPHSFEAVIEHTCYCAIDPATREKYVRAVEGALTADGVVLGLFYNHGRPGGPPFDTSEADVRKHFSNFTFERFRKAADSFPGRAHEEWEAVLRLTNQAGDKK